MSINTDEYIYRYEHVSFFKEVKEFRLVFCGLGPAVLCYLVLQIIKGVTRNVFLYFFFV